MFPGINPNLAAVSIRPGSPGIPTITNITFTATQATIVFSPPDHNGGAAIQSFVAVSNPGGVIGVSTGSGGGSIVVNGLQPNTMYTFQVYAVNELATGTVRPSISPIVTPTTFSYAPVVNSVVVNSSTQVTIIYTAPTFTGGSTITSYTAVSSPGAITKSVATTASGTIVVTGLITATNYIFTVYATSAVGIGATTTTNAIITFAIVPDPPSFGTLAAPSSTIINVPYIAPGYNGGSTITSYTAIGTPGNITLTTATSASGTFIFTGLTTATSYSFKVYATNIIGNSSSSTSNSITTPSVVPFNPILGTAIATSATWITIPYTAPYAGGSTITSYTAISNPGSVSATTSTASSGVIVVKGLSPITAYTFNVYATNAIGNSSSSTSNSVTTLDVVPNAPTISSIVISPTTNAMNITYSVPASNGGSAVTSYTAVASATTVISGTVSLAIAAGNPFSFCAGGFPGGSSSATFGNVSVQAFGGGGGLSSSSIVQGGAGGTWSQTNAGIYAGGINGGSGGINSNGSSGTGGGGAGIGRPGGNANSFLGAGVGAGACLPAAAVAALALVGRRPSYTTGGYATGIGGGGGGAPCGCSGRSGSFGGGGGGAAGPTNGKTYGGQGGAGWGLIQYIANSNTTATFVCSSRCITLPANVTSLTIWVAGAGGSGGNAPANNVSSSGGGAGALVYFTTATSAPIATTSTAILNGSLQLYNLKPNVSYSVLLYATNNFGNGDNSASITTATNIIVPSAPTSVSASASSGTWASVSFTGSTDDGGSPITYYSATLQPGNIVSTATSSPISFKGIIRATSYTATVVAYNVGGTSAISNIASFSTPAELPTAATITSATTPVRGGIRVFYTAPTDNGGAAITSYISSVGTPTLGSGYVDISGLSDNTTYNVTISAVNSTGQGPASNTIAQTTWGSQSYTAEGAFIWVAPAGVKSVSVVAIGGGGGFYSTTPGINGGDSYFISTSTVWGGGGKGKCAFCPGSAPGGATSGFITGCSPGGGYVGGSAGLSRYAGGGGGAGGYWGPGGAGGCYNSLTYVFAATGVYGGQGGCGVNCGASGYHGQGGGGVGLYGACSNTTNLIVSGGGGAGPGGTSSAAFTTNGGTYGGGAGGRWSAGVARRQGGGGGLGYRNNISVTSGTSYLVNAGSARQSVCIQAGRGAVRIVWPGDIRQFPNTLVSSSNP